MLRYKTKSRPGLVALYDIRPPCPRPWARRRMTMNVCDTWPVRHQTYVTFPAARHYRPLAGAMYTAWWWGNMPVNNLSRVAFDSAVAGIWIHKLLIAAALPLGDQATGVISVLISVLSQVIVLGCLNKVQYFYFHYNFGKGGPIFIIFSLLNSQKICTGSLN